MGEEYIICKTNNAATWHLKINSKKKHPYIVTQKENRLYSFRWKG